MPLLGINKGAIFKSTLCFLYSLIHFNLVIITTNHIYIGAVYIMSGLIGGSIGFGFSIIHYYCLNLFRIGLKSLYLKYSILHLNLTFYAMLSLNSSGIYCGIVISLSHSLSSIGLFLLFYLYILILV